MKSTHILAIAVVATIACVYVGSYVLGRQQNAASAPEPNNALNYLRAVREAEANRPASPATESGSIAANAAPQAVGTDVATQFQSSRDYRTLFESLLQSKADNAGLYATHILSLCTSMQSVRFDATPAISDLQRKAQELMTARCASFTPAELDGKRRLEAAKDPRTQGTLTDLKWRWADVKVLDPSRKAMLENILQSKDLLLLDWVGPALLMATEDTNSVKFNGKVVDSRPFARSVHFAAWTAAACEVSSAGCGSGDPFVVEACARENTCLASRQEVMRHDVEKRYGNDALALYDSAVPQFVSAIRSADTSAFGL